MPVSTKYLPSRLVRFRRFSLLDLLTLTITSFVPLLTNQTVG